MVAGKPAAQTPVKRRIKKGDQVVVITGRDKGRRGEVLKVMPKEGRVVVQGVMKVKRHQRPTPQGGGGITEKEAPIHISNVALIDPSTERPTRVGFRTLDDGRKVRVSRRSNEVLDS